MLLEGGVVALTVQSPPGRAGHDTAPPAVEPSSTPVPTSQHDRLLKNQKTELRKEGIALFNNALNDRVKVINHSYIN